jgi:hypothetical protein
MLLTLVPAVFLGSESLGTSQIWDFPFRCLLRLTGSRWNYSTPPPHGVGTILQSQSHIATDGQSVSKCWCRAPSGAHDRIYIIVWQLGSCFCGASSLTWGRVCLLYSCWLLPAQSHWSESLGSRDHILLSQIWDFLFVASYDSQGDGGGVRPRLHTGLELFLLQLSYL